MVATFGADMTPIKRAAQPREVRTVVYMLCILHVGSMSNVHHTQ